MGLFVMAHVLAWSVIPAVFNHNLPLDVIEGLAWGQEWQAGYHKHPPLSAWAMESFRVAFAYSDAAQYLLSQLFVAVALVAVWLLARDILPARDALLAALTLVGVYFYNYTTPEFNANVCLMPFWALTAFFVWRGVRDDAIGCWILAGLVGGFGCLAKYAMGFLLLPILAALLLVPSFRKSMRRPGPYVALAMLCVVIAFHVFWLTRHGLTTFDYAMARASTAGDPALNHIWFPLKFLLGLVLALTPAVLLLICAGLTPRRRPLSAPEDGAARRYILVVVLGPIILLCLTSLVTGWRLRTMWGATFLLLAPLAILVTFHLRDTRRARIVLRRAWALLFLAPLLVYAGVSGGSPYLTGKAKRIHFPGRELARVVESKWSERFAQPLLVVIGPTWEAGCVSNYSDSHPAVVLDGRLEDSPWLTEERIRATGAAIIYPKGQGERFAGPWLQDPGKTQTIELSSRFEAAVPVYAYELTFLAPEQHSD